MRVVMPRVTIFLPISRPDFLEKLFSAIEFMDCDAEETSLVAYVDGDQELCETVQRFTNNSKLENSQVIQRPDWNKDRINNTADGRRKRIAAIKNESRELIPDCDYILSIEDDSIPPSDTLTRLLDAYAIYPYAGMITGVEVGRWGIQHLGIWKADDVYETKEIYSLLPGEDIQEIDAAGFYCYLTTRDRYIEIEYDVWLNNVLGPDVGWSMAMRQAGYKHYVDWGLNVAHMLKGGHELTVKNANLVTARIVNQQGQWVRKIE